ncbi:uncharacterized protein LOC108154206 [Drosophila miranda]|uniref:uncharacterized protein LOC108154206 n=1 Tax=Drosophila miranda TaxID=7229 RepID=UPI0007E77C9A|nr:uncharacterized protein LOC108154206 [Drosophila miranda]
MDRSEEDQQPTEETQRHRSRQLNASVDALVVLRRNTERIMDSVIMNLDALNIALDHLENRTDRVLAQLRQYMQSMEDLDRSNAARWHGGYGDPDATI